jgi:hypothetical protein
MRLRYLWLVLLIGISVLSGCGAKDSDYSGFIFLDRLTILNKGAATLYPTTVTVTITPSGIEYIAQNADVGVISQWSRKIDPADYFAAQQIINQYQLYQSDDVTLPDGTMGCMGHMGMTITIEPFAGTSHAFDIAGNTMCKRSSWPEGVQALINLQDNLIVKYQ